MIVVLGGGKHSVHGLGGNDRICGGDGEDRLYGEKGSDRIDGGGGDDTLLGDRGADMLSGGEGSDYLDGQKGSDEIDGGGRRRRQATSVTRATTRWTAAPGNGDELDGGLGDEKLETGGEGDGDIVIGNLGTDNLSGGPGNRDVVRGDGGIDTIDGGGGNEKTSPPSRPRPAPEWSSALRPGPRPATATTRSTTSTTSSARPFNDTITGDDGHQPDRRRTGQRRPQRRRPGGGGDTDRASAAPAPTTARAFGEVELLQRPQPAADRRRRSSSIAASTASASSSPGSATTTRSPLSYSGSAFVVTDPTGVETREGSGCTASGAPLAPVVPGKPSRTDPADARPEANRSGPTRPPTCPSGLGISFILIDAGGGNDTVGVGGGIPGSLSVRDHRRQRQRHDQRRARATTCSNRATSTRGTSGTDVLNGEGRATTGLIADPGGDQLNAGDGNDLLVSSAALCQGHRFDGGGGLDTVSYARSKPSGTPDHGRSAGPAATSGGCAAPDQILASSESLEGSEGNDKMVGDSEQQHAARTRRQRHVPRQGRQRLDRSDRRRKGQADRLRPRRPTRAPTTDPEDPKPKSC